MRDYERENLYGTFEKSRADVDKTNSLLLSRNKNVQWNMWKNVGWFCLAWLLLTMGSSVIYFIESTIYDNEGLGVVALAVSMVTSAVGCYVTEPILEKIGCRWTLVINGVGNIVFYLANFHANWYTLIPASAIDGFTTGLGTVAAYAFVAHTANVHARRTGIDLDRIQSRVSVVYLVFCNAGIILGNALSPLIFGINSQMHHAHNVSLALRQREAMMAKCDYTRYVVTDSLLAPPPSVELVVDSRPEISYLQLVELMELCIGVTILSIFIVIVFVDTSEQDADCKQSSDKNHNTSFDDSDEESKAMVSFVFDDYRIYLLIPTALVLISGNSFWAADYAKCYVALSVGLDSLGYVTLWSGVGGTVSGVVFGWFNTKDFRIIPLVVAPLAQIGVLIFLLFWTPDKDSLLLLCLLTVCWFLGIGVRNALFPALIAVVCPDMLKSAYATLYTMTFIGSTMVFLWSNWLRMDIKIFIMLAMFSVSLFGYLCLESILYRKRRQPITTPPTDHNGNPS